jgi:hypothetical protein
VCIINRDRCSNNKNNNNTKPALFRRSVRTSAQHASSSSSCRFLFRPLVQRVRTTHDEGRERRLLEVKESVSKRQKGQTEKHFHDKRAPLFVCVSWSSHERGGTRHPPTTHTNAVQPQKILGPEGCAPACDKKCHI